MALRRRVGVAVGVRAGAARGVLIGAAVGVLAGVVLATACARSTPREPITNVLDLRARDSAPLGAYWILEEGYPPKAQYDEQGRHITGHVRLEFTIDSNGRVRAVHIVGEEPNRRLGRSVSAAMKRWQYAPTPQNAERRPVRVSISFTMGTSP